MRVLVLEDDNDVAKAVERALQQAGFGVDMVATIVDAEISLSANAYDALVLDRTVSDGDSLEHLRSWRLNGLKSAALFLTAHDQVSDRVAGFEEGGDDYLGKPFAMAELVVRLQRLCRQQSDTIPANQQIGDLAVDLARREVRRAGVLLSLTNKELAVLERLAARPGIIVTKEDLMEHCWDERTDPRSNTIEVHIASLRRKLGSPPLISTIRGVGYRIDEPTSASE